MNRNELEQFMKELGNKKYGNGTLMSIDKDLNMLELSDTIDSVEWKVWVLLSVLGREYMEKNVWKYILDGVYRYWTVV